MPVLLELPDQYGYVLAVATSTFFINTFHGVLTSKARSKSGLKYPTAYASQELADKDPAAHQFNCAQRAHANFTENQPSFLGAILIAGLRFPVAAAGVGAFWAVSRIVYALGYTSSAGPKGRSKGAIGSTLSDLTAKCLAAYTSAMFILGN